MSIEPSTASLDDLVRWIGTADVGSYSHTRGSTELIRRQLVSSIQATDAQKRAADAAIANANYLWWSVVIAAVAAVASAISAAVAAYSTFHH